MSTAIWAATAVTPAATDRIPVDVSGAGGPSRWTGQQVADVNTLIGGTVTALGSISTNTAIDLSLGGYFSATIAGNLTFSITNVPASAGVTFVLALTNGGAFTVTLPGSVTIIGGSPVLSAAGTDWLVFRTLNGGTAWTLEVVGNPRDADLATWATITPGTGVGTALATNVGSAGAVVTNGGALGTPSSGTLTNATGLPPAAITQSGATSNQVLAWNGSAWAPATPSAGSGDVVGPASATDNAIARFDTTTGKLLQDSAITVSDASGSSVTLASAAGNALAIAATAPAATTGASVAGVAASLTAGPAVASTNTAGAAAGGSVTITAGAAARLTSGNADGGSINLVPGAGIGTGRSGQILIPGGSAATPALSFSNDSGTDTGLYAAGGNYLSFALGGTAFAHMSTNEGGFTLIGNTLLNYTRYILAATTSITEPTYMRGGVTFNSGATALVTRTLPGAAAGAQYTYVVMDSDGIKIQAASGDEIRVIDKVTAAAGYIQSTTIGSVVCLLAVDSTTWVALHIHGVWTDGTFTYDDTANTTP